MIGLKNLINGVCHSQLGMTAAAVDILHLVSSQRKLAEVDETKANDSHIPANALYEQAVILIRNPEVNAYSIISCLNSYWNFENI